MDDLSEMLGSIMNDPESMQQIKELAEMLNGSSSPEDANTQSSSPTPDMNVLMNMAKLLSDNSADDKNRTLLLALKPHLSAGRQPKVDRAIKLLRLYSMFISLRDSGMLSNLDKLI